MEKHSQSGALGIRMLDGSGNFLSESKRSFPSPLTSFFKLMGLSRVFPSSKLFARYSLGWLSQHQNHTVDVLAGAFMLAKRETLIKLKGFDEAFFMYGEDIDLSYRIQKLGFTNYYFAESSIIHFKGESTKKGSLNYVKMFYEAMSIFVQKHYGGKSANVFAFVLKMAIWLRAALSGITRLFPRIWLFSKIRKTKEELPRNILLVGSEEDCREVTKLFFKETQSRHEYNFINAIEANPAETLGRLKEKIIRDNVTEVIFCEGTLAFREIIEAVQLIKPKAAFRFHGEGTMCIVGSNSKDTAGEYTALEG